MQCISIALGYGVMVHSREQRDVVNYMCARLHSQGPTIEGFRETKGWLCRVVSFVYVRPSKALRLGAAAC